MTTPNHPRSDEPATRRIPSEPLPPSPDMQFVVPPIATPTEPDEPAEVPPDMNKPSPLAAGMGIIAVMVMVTAVIVLLVVLSN